MSPFAIDDIVTYVFHTSYGTLTGITQEYPGNIWNLLYYFCALFSVALIDLQLLAAICVKETPIIIRNCFVNVWILSISVFILKNEICPMLSKILFPLYGVLFLEYILSHMKVYLFTLKQWSILYISLLPKYWYLILWVTEHCIELVK